MDRAVEPVIDDEHHDHHQQQQQMEPSSCGSLPPTGLTEDDKTAESARCRKKKNFNLKKQLSKADTKLRDLFAPVSRRGSGASTGGGAGGTVSPHLPDSKAVSPQEEESAFHFPEPSNPVCVAPEGPVIPAESVDLTIRTNRQEEVALFDSDGVPIRPPRRLKKSLSAAAQQQHKAITSRDSGWKRTWYSSDESGTVPAAVPATQVLDLRFDPTDESCYTGFFDNIVRKFSKDPWFLFFFLIPNSSFWYLFGPSTDMDDDIFYRFSHSLNTTTTTTTTTTMVNGFR